MRTVRRSRDRGARRWAGGLLVAVLAGLGFALACDDGVAPRPPKGVNLPPETFLSVRSDSVAPHFYKVPLRWLGSDADGRVVGFRYRWSCLDMNGGPCPMPSPDWIETSATSDTFILAVPLPRARYAFELAAVDDDGAVDPSPARQVFDLFNTAPSVDFQPASKPTRTLPAVTFYLQGVDPDSTADPADRDSESDLAWFRAWLDGNEAAARTAPFSDGAITFFPEDFQGRVDTMRTVFVQVFDDGGAVSTIQEHTWEVVGVPAEGILLVDDCRMGGGIEERSDQSYRNVLEAAAAQRYVVLDVETIPRLSSTDFEATLSLFDRVVWYTDADTQSSGALELARGGLDALLTRSGHLFLSSGFAFGTRSAFGDQENRFRDLFGIETVFEAPDGSTNFAIDLGDSVQADVQPGLTEFRFVNLGLGAIMDCFRSRRDADTRSLYFYPPGTFVRILEAPLPPFVNSEQFDIGVGHQLAGGGATAFVSFPIGFPMNGGENEIEIRELLRQTGILEP